MPTPRPARRLSTRCPPRPDDPSRGVVAGLMALCDKYGIPRETIDVVFHGTTIATNAILEHDGARHRHDHDRRLSRHPAHRPPPAAAALLDHAGHPLAGPAAGQAPPSQDGEGAAGAAAGARCWCRSTRTSVRAGGARAERRAGVEAIAICFLFSYLDPAHEERARAIVREEYPECFVTTSSSVSPQFREFERFTTAAMNAFVGPKVRNYVTRLESEIGASGFKADLRIMASNGGVATPAMVAEQPVLTLLSGPAAGVLGGDWAGGLSGPAQPHHLRRRRHQRRHRHRHRRRLRRGDRARHLDRGLPRAGADDRRAHDRRRRRLDRLRRPGRRLQVGPRSAGAEPGPAAYGRGGTAPTVTDANVVLGRLDREQLPGRRACRSTRSAARRVIGELARELGLDRPRGGRGRAHRDQQQHGQRHPLAHRPEGHRSARLLAGRVRRRRAAARRRGGRHAGHPRGDRAAASGHHLGDRAS